jgi:hypothetical protein
MRRWHFTAALGVLSTLALAGLFAVDLFAEKPKDSKNDDKPVAEKGSAKGSDVHLTARSESAAKLPITKVVLFNSGVGYFERQGEVDGDVRIDLAFNIQDVNDILKSMVVQDLNGGHVSAVSFDSQEPLDKTLRSFSIDLSKNPSFAQILDQARGERVEAVLQQSNTTQPGTVNGSIIGIERQKQPAGKDGTVDVELLNMWCAEGIRSFKLSDVQRLRFVNPVIESEFKKALDVVTQGHDMQKKSVSLSFTGTGRRTVKVGYVVENPIWKTSYRLVLDKEKTPFLQGWAVVENNTDEDWNAIAMNLISGRPISFQMDLYQPLYVPRPIIEPELFASLRPPTYTGPVMYGDGVNEATGNPDQNLNQLGRAGQGQQNFRGNNDRRKQQLDNFLQNQQRAQNQAAQNNQANGNNFNPQQGVMSVATAMDLGDFFQYEIDHSVSLGRQKSAMLPIINKHVEASRVSIYNERVQAKFPLLGLRFKNNTEMHLTQGPITVFDGANYAGDARILDLQPKEERLISYAIDLGTEVTPIAAHDNGKRTSVKIVKGIIQTTFKTRESKTYNICNRSEQDRTVVIEHPFRSQFKLISEVKPVEIASDVQRFQVKVAKGEKSKLEVSEERQDGERIEINNTDDNQIKLIISDPAASKDVKDALQKSLQFKWELAKTLQDIQNNQREQDRIKTEQPRLRENLKVLPESDPLVKKLRDKLLAQENDIEKYEADIKTLQAKADKQRKEFESYLAGLTIEN